MSSQTVSLFQTRGFSMWPFLKSDEKLVIQRAAIEDLKIGDIILYKSRGQLVCHRLIRKSKAKGAYLLYARGDNSTSLPEAVLEEDYLGKATAVIKGVKAVRLTTRRRQCINRIIVIAGPLISRGLRAAKPMIKILKRP